MLYQKQHIMWDLVEIYKERGSKKKLADIFFPVLNDVLYKYCKYEGASFFIWDSYMNHYKLLSSTGIEGIQKNNYNNVVYQAGKNKTGSVADTKKPIIYDDLTANGNSHHKYKEETIHVGKTMMAIPIFRPSKRDEVIGILRFTNKQNSTNTDVIDHFNDADVEIMAYASDYLALIIDYFLGEKERHDFISKLSHEFISPASSIRNSADRLLKNNNPAFIERNFVSYLGDIRDLAELQLQQADTNLHISSIRVNTPRAQKYKEMGKYLLRDIIQQGKKTVIPFARMEGLRFDNIDIDGSFPSWELHIDKGAFRTIFYNLLANAIKYRNPKADFTVKISGYEYNEWLIVCVSDMGIGIDTKDKDRIFLMGYRGDNVTEHNSDGFGIGLPVVKQIIVDFEGEISVTNFLNPTIFEIKLPKLLLNDKYTKEIKWNSPK
jgi:signal transduction histidine kinase